MNPRIHPPSEQPISWTFTDNGGPTCPLKTRGWTHTVNVDPFPCYSHDIELVAKEVEYVEERLKLPFLPDYFILAHESCGRTNGWADGNHVYLDEKDPEGNWKTEPRPFIVLAGKRIPLHPAMTRYLVAHEIGHTTHSNLAHKMGLKYDAFAKMYAEDVRKIPYEQAYGGLKWHLNTGEIIANDVRVGLLEREVEFWPHEVGRPNTEVVQWWLDRIKEHFV